MNLVKIQDELKGFPTQTIMAYVNGSNPEVPPYIALAELNRRKQMEQRRAEPPTQSIKEKLESEVTNPQGIAQLPQAQPGMPPQGPPSVPQGMPPQMAAAPQRPPGMAAGGIARIPTRSDMFHYAPGGIVAFAGEDESLVKEKTPEDFGAVREPMGDINPRKANWDVPNSFSAANRALEISGQNIGSHNPLLDLPGALESQNKGAQPAGIAALPDTTQLQDLVPGAAQRLRDIFTGKVTLPEVQSKEDIRKAMVADALANGDLEKAKMLTQVPGEALIPLVKKLNEQNEEQRAGFKEGQGRMGLAALSNALIAAGEATRGRREPGFFAGTGDALGGFGKSYNAFTAEDVKRLEAQKAVERAQNIEVATLQSKIDDMRSAYANGTVQDKQEAQKALADQAYKMETMQMGAAKDILAQALAQSQAETLRSHYKATELQAAEQLAATKAHYADQAVKSAAALKVQQELRQDAIDQRARAKLDEAMKGDSRIQMLSKRLNDPVNPVEIGSEQYDKIMDEVERIRRKIIAEHPDFDIPDTSGTPQYAKDAKGNVIVSYDNFKTHQPVKRALTGGR